MKEETRLAREKDFLRDQQTFTGGVRVYCDHVRTLEEGRHLGDGIYRFDVDIPFKDVRHVKGVLSCRVADSSDTPGTGRRLGCYIHKISFKSEKAIVDLLIISENVDVIAVNIYGRIVNSLDPPL